MAVCLFYVYLLQEHPCRFDVYSPRLQGSYNSSLLRSVHLYPLIAFIWFPHELSKILLFTNPLLPSPPFAAACNLDELLWIPLFFRFACYVLGYFLSSAVAAYGLCENMFYYHPLVTGVVQKFTWRRYLSI